MSLRLRIIPNAIIVLFVIISSAAISTITAVPATFDAVETPTVLLEPPQLDEVETVAANGRFGSNVVGVNVPPQQLLQQQPKQLQQDIRAIDSYGNPIEFLTPIDTPDGRKVVSAQGVQFEIPNYASGITDIRKPVNELLPPNIGEFDIKQHQQLQHHQEINALLNIDNNNNNNNENQNENDDEDNRNIKNNNNNNADVNQFEAAVSYNDYNDATTDQPDLQLDINLPVRDDNVYNHNNDNKYKDKKIMTNIYHNDQNGQETTTIPHTIHMKTLTTLPIVTSTTTMATSEDKLSPFIHTFNNIDSISQNSIPLKSSQLTNLVESSSTTEAPSTISASSHTTHVVPTISVNAAPLSNGNFNYPNIPTDITIINRIAAKYHNPLPTLEPIVVAEPNTEEDLQFNNVQQESIKVEVNYNQIPEYLLDLNDTNIAGPVAYMPAEDQSAHKFISWDLLPPEEKVDNSLIPANIKPIIQSVDDRVQTVDSQYSASSHNEEDTATATATMRTTTTTQRYNRGNVHFTNSTPAPTKTTRRTTTRRTTPPLTTRRYTTTTTPRTTTTTTTTTTTSKPAILTTTESADTEYYRLENGDSYTLPPWLTGLDYADLDVAVTFIVPTDNNEYNHTIDRDIAPPLEPFLDLKDIHLPAPESESTSSTSTTTTTTKTTTSRPSTTVTYRTTPSTRITTTPRIKSTTARSYWIQNNAVANTQKPSSSNINPVIPNHISQSSTTRKPNYNFHTSFNTIQNNGQYSTRVTTSTVAPFSGEAVANVEQQAGGQNFNPFLPSRQNVGSNFKPTTLTTTTTTTTTTTPTTEKPEIIAEENPFVPTLPSWLEGTDYSDLGPAVPFIYDPAALEQNVDSDLQAPFRFQADKPNFLTDTQSQFPANQIPDASSALANTPFAASTISNSKVNAPSSIQTDADSPTTTFNNKNEQDNQQKHIPAPFEDDTFINNTPVKTTFSKGQGGKVISNTANTPAAPIGQRNPFLPNRPLAASSNNIPSFAPAYNPLPTQNYAATTARSYSQTSTYKNRFGGPPGILRPYDNVRS